MLALLAIATTAGAQGNSINGHEYVDLGLPSGLLWATCNVGATKPEERGDYFAWGETTPKETYSWDNYKWCKGTGTTFTKYCSKSESGFEGFTDELTTLFREPMLIGLSRKSMIYKPLGITPDEALTGTIALDTLALERGARILRVHDPRPARETIKLMFPDK